MGIGVFQTTITNAAGDVIPSASVEIKLEVSGALAALYTDAAGTIPASNPVTCDVNGFVRVYLTDSILYRIKATSGAFEREWRHVPILNPSAAVTQATVSALLNPQTDQEDDADANTINTLFASEYIRVKRYAVAGTPFTGLNANRVAHTAAARSALLVANEHDGAKVVFEHGGYVLNGPLVIDGDGVEMIGDGADILGGSDMPTNGFLIHSLAGGDDTNNNQDILDDAYGAGVVSVRTNKANSLEDCRIKGLRFKVGFATNNIGGLSITGFTRGCRAAELSFEGFKTYSAVFNGSWSFTLDTIRCKGNGSLGVGLALGVTGLGRRNNAVACNDVEGRGLHCGSHLTGMQYDFGAFANISGTFEGNAGWGFDSQSMKALTLKGYFENNTLGCISAGGTNGTDYADSWVLLPVYMNILDGRRGIRLNSVKNSIIMPVNRYDEDDDTDYESQTYFIPGSAGTRVFGNTFFTRGLSTTYWAGFSELDQNKNTFMINDAGAIIASFGDVTVQGAFRHKGSLLGLYNATAVTRQTVSGSRAANAALADLAAEVAETGLVIDSTTA